MSARLANYKDLELINGQVTPFTSGAVGDYATGTGATISAASTAFSNSGVTFTSADVGKAIVIPGAGANGGTLTTTIAAVAGTSATLTDAASVAAPASYLSSASVQTAQSGGGSYAPGDTIDFTAGTAALNARLTVAATKVVSASVAAGGSGGTNGSSQTVYGTTGTGTKFAANVTITGGAITAVNSITLAGKYSANPTSLAAEPVTGNGLTGATLTIVMGVLSASVTIPGNYSATPSNPVTPSATSGSGTGATFNFSFTTSGAWSYGTDNTALINAASSPLYLPKGQSYYTSNSITGFNLRTIGEGNLRDSAQRTQAPNLIGQTTAPSSSGSISFVGSAFTGDLSRVASPTGKQISGSTTLGQPTSGYSIPIEGSLRFDYLSNSSGHNQSTSTNTGRTGAAAHYVKADSIGQGDTYCYFANGFVNGAKSGATHFLANPAVVLFAGSCSPGTDSVYLNPVEISMSDDGYDVAAINFVANQTRTNDRGNLSAVWFGYRSQSQGAAAIDAHFTASGKAKIGIDLTGLTSNSSGTWTNAAMTLLGNDRIYFNATAGSTAPGYASTPGTTYLLYSTGNSGLQAVVNSSSAFLFTSSLGFLYASTLTVAQNSNNKFVFAGASTGSAPSLSISASSDTNQDFKIAALGTGKIQFNNAGSFSANGAVATTMTSVGPTGANTTVQEWLTIKNASGVTRYIPCY